jgi:hypothetical protein
MARWITVRKPFDYHWPGRSAVTTFREEHLGDHFVKDEVADFAVSGGYATEGKADETSRSSKGKRAKNAKTADDRPDDAVAQPDMADADRSAGRQPVDPDAE